MKQTQTTPQTLPNYPKSIFIGINNDEKIYLSAPSWDCGWYWGFGYLGNKNCHYHVDGLNAKENINLFDAFKKHFGTSLVVRDSQLWTFFKFSYSSLLIVSVQKVAFSGLFRISSFSLITHSPLS